MLTEAEYERRKPLWTALSELWLDTELDRTDIERIADVALESAYSIAELNEIYLYEVAPVVYSNLLTPAGIWTAFDEQWLHIAARKNAENRRAWIRFWVWSGIGRKLMTYACEKKWQEVLVQVQAGTCTSQV